MTTQLKLGFTGTLKDLKAKGEAPDVSIELKIEFPFATAGEDGMPIDLQALGQLVGRRVAIQMAGSGVPDDDLPLFSKDAS